MKIVALVHETLVPPEDPGDVDVTTAEWKTEFDVCATLREMGHEVHAVGVSDDLAVIRRSLARYKPRIVFNLLEEFAGHAILDQNVVSYLELVRMPYTGCNPRGLILARDKGLSKKVLIWHRIPTPDFAVFPMKRKIQRPKGLALPLIVKSLVEEASQGISASSVVHDDAELVERVRYIHEQVGTDAIAEAFIDGREFYVGLLGNERLMVFPTWELFLDRLPDDVPRIATELVKFDEGYQTRYGVDTGPARELPAGLNDRIAHTCKRAFRALGLSGYARMDLRLGADGRFYILEANPNPQLAYGEDLAESAEFGGITYESLLQRILNLGLRYRRRS
ncbi:MAG: ATP-grasp domain-containing protein [Planctomycetes bacterium]|nr:ATP-grasp domain-containing protein [Planctomycetota bacterium]